MPKTKYEPGTIRRRHNFFLPEATSAQLDALALAHHGNRTAALIALIAAATTKDCAEKK